MLVKTRLDESAASDGDEEESDMDEGAEGSGHGKRAWKVRKWCSIGVVPVLRSHTLATGRTLIARLPLCFLDRRSSCASRSTAGREQVELHQGTLSRYGSPLPRRRSGERADNTFRRTLKLRLQPTATVPGYFLSSCARIGCCSSFVNVGHSPTISCVFVPGGVQTRAQEGIFRRGR